MTVGVIVITITEVYCGGKRLCPEEEPTTEQIFGIYRTLLADPKYYTLRVAGILKEDNVPQYYKGRNPVSNDHSVYSMFKFNSSDYLRRISILVGFIPLLERSALHVYDDEHDITLATGPQVDQDYCRLHLDYMNHIVNKKMPHITNSSMRSIFNLINSYGTPQLGLVNGASVFPGNYGTCTKEKLDIIRAEMDIVDPNASARYFASNRNIETTPTTPIEKMFKTFIWNVGPYLGYARDYGVGSIAGYNQSVRLLPMRYCYAGLRWPQWGNTSYERRNFILRVGVCLPETCDSKSFELYGDKIRQLVDVHMSKFHEGYYIENLYCLPDEESDLRNPFNYTDAVMCIVFNAAWLTTIFIITAITVYKKYIRTRHTSKKKGDSVRHNKQKTSFPLKNLLNGFDLIKNYNESQSTKPAVQTIERSDESQPSPKQSRVNLRPLEGLKAYGCMTVITSHECMVLLGGVWNVEWVHYLLANSWFAPAANIFPQIVNVFFVVTGVVTAQVLLVRSRNSLLHAKFWFLFIIYRYVRIIPIYLLVHWFLKSSYRFINYGPYWDYGTSHTGWSHICSENSYWDVILPSANYISPALQCNPVGWYIATDLQLALITPVVMILLCLKPLLGYLAVIVSIAVAIFNHISYFYHHERDPRGVFEWTAMNLTRVTHDTFVGYTILQFRFVSYFIGIICGHLLHLYDRGIIKEWPKSFIFYGKILVIGCMYLLWFSPYFTSVLLAYDDDTLRITAAVFGGTIHTIISLAIAVFVILITTGHWPVLARHLSRRIFETLAGMSLSTTLVHLPLIYYRGMSVKFPNHLNTYHLSSSIMTRIVESLALGFVFHLIYEIPLRKTILKLLLSTFDQPKQKDPKPKTN